MRQFVYMDMPFQAIYNVNEDNLSRREHVNAVVLSKFWLINLQLSEPHPPPTSNLGNLSLLPTELLYDILEQLSLQAVISLRNSNRFAKFLVDNHPQFRRIIQTAPLTIRSLIAIDSSEEISLTELYHKIVMQKDCEICGAESPYMWLPSASRLCQSCICRIPMPWTAEELQTEFGLTEQDLVDVPSFRYIRDTILRQDVETVKKQGMIRFYDGLVAIERSFQHLEEIEDRVVDPKQRRTAAGREAALCLRRCRKYYSFFEGTDAVGWWRGYRKKRLVLLNAKNQERT